MCPPGARDSVGWPSGAASLIVTETSRQRNCDTIGGGSEVTVAGAEERVHSEGLRVDGSEDAGCADIGWSCVTHCGRSH